MKVESRIAIFVLLLIVLQVNLDYPMNMGMYWGFSVGDDFWFTMNYTGEYDDINDLEGYIHVDRFQQPNNYSGTVYNFDLGFDDITVYYDKNGHYVEMDWAYFVFTLLYYHVYPDDVVICGSGLHTPFAFPLGNLSCLANLILERYAPDSVVFLESEDYWGFEITSNRFYNTTSIYPNWNVTMHAHFDYSLDDGFLAHLHGLTTYVDTGDIFQEVRLDRNGLDRQIMTPVSSFFNAPPITDISNTTPATDFYITTPVSQVSNTTLNSLFYEPLIHGVYLTAVIAWAIVIIFIFYDYKKRRFLNA